MNSLRNYFNEIVHEFRYKVSWPTFEELQASAIVVLITTLIISAIIFVMDQASSIALNTYYNLFK
jgi:preprotein translocase subunit SecE